MQLKCSDLSLMEKVQPLKPTFVLVLLRGEPPARFARYTKEGYSVQGILGFTPVDKRDLWADISDLMPTNC